MESFEPVKIEITKADGSKEIIDLPPDGNFPLAAGELARVITDDNVASLVKMPNDGPLAIVLEGEDGSESIIMVGDFFTIPGAGQDSPRISITAANIDGQWNAQDFVTTPTVSFSSGLPSTPGDPNSDPNNPIVQAGGPQSNAGGGNSNNGPNVPEELLFIAPQNNQQPPNDPQPLVINVSDVSVSEPAVPGQLVAANFIVTLSSPATSVITVDYQTSPGSAQAGADYQSVSGTVTFNPGEQVKLVPVQVIGDLIFEGLENFTLTLSDPIGNAIIGDGVGIGNIIDAQSEPVINLIGPSAVPEPLTPGSFVEVQYSVVLSNASTSPVVVDFSTADISATAGSDYDTASGTLTFAPGETSKVITVRVNGDNIDELDELYSVNLSNPSGGSIGAGSVQTTILDDEADVPTVSISDAAPVVEGNTATFEVTLSNPSAFTTTVDFQTVAGTATEGDDYIGVSGTLTFPPGVTSLPITVQVKGDDLAEFVENYSVVLSNPVGGMIDDGTADTDILDDPGDRDVEVSIDGPDFVFEGNPADFTISLSEPSILPVTVTFASMEGLAISGLDYDPESGTLTIPAGSTSTTVTVQTLDDVIFEGDEDFSVELLSATNATIVDPVAETLIIDNDCFPELNISGPAMVLEPANPGDMVPVVYTITLTHESAFTTTVDFSTADGTAMAGSDYIANSGSLTFAPGEMSKTVTIFVKGDLLNELDESYSVNLSNPSGATIGDGSQETIIKDDPGDQIKVSINDAEPVVEGQAAVFTVSLSGASGDTVTVNFNTADGTAVSGADYDPEAGTLTFNPGETSKQVIVSTVDDNVFENTEDFSVELSGAVNAMISDPTGVGQILDNDREPVINISGPMMVQEPSNPGDMVPVEYVVTLTNPSAFPVEVNFETVDITTTSGDDYAPISGTLIFAPGETSKVLTVQVKGDLLDEPNEFYSVDLSNPVGASLGTDSVETKIKDDQGDRVEVSISDADPVVEGQGAVFTVSLSGVSGNTVTVNFSTVDGTAVFGDDYDAQSGILTFNPGETSKTVTVTTIDDTVFENTEDFGVELSGASNADIVVPLGVGEILDNDSAPVINISGPNVVNEPGSVGAMIPVEYTVTLSNPSAFPVTVDFSPQDISATEGFDYILSSGTLTFAPGETSKVITVQVKGDNLDEIDELYSVDLSNPSGASLGTDSVTTKIIDDRHDDLCVDIKDAGYVHEGGVLSFKVVLSEPPSAPVTVDYMTVNGSAMAGSDYNALSGTVTFGVGETEKIIQIQTIDDNIDEHTEDMFVQLMNANGAKIKDDEGKGLIKDNDPKPTVSISDGDPIIATEALDINDLVEVDFVVSLSAPSEKTITVDYETKEGDGSGASATENDDYIPISGTLTFLPGQTEQTVTVLVKSDQIQEELEGFRIELSDPSNVTIADGVGVAEIQDNPLAPSLIVGTNDDDTIDGTPGQNVIIGDIGGKVEMDLDPTIKITYVLDTSGSMDNDDRLDLLQEAIKDLNDELLELVEQGATVNICVVEFNHYQDTGFLGEFNLTSQTIDDLNDLIDDLDAGGWTSYTEALYEAQQAIDAHQDTFDYNTVLFVSDGNPAGPKIHALIVYLAVMSQQPTKILWQIQLW